MYIRDHVNPGTVAVLQKAGIECLTKKEDFLRGPSDPMSMSFFDQFDAMVAEATNPDHETMYLFAQAIIQRKPALCYYQKNREPRNLMSFLVKPEAKNIVLHCYTQKNLESVLLGFLRQLHARRQFKERADIKFTLRITPALERYLAWAVQGKNMSKADFVRSILEKHIGGDKYYISQLEKRKKF